MHFMVVRFKLCKCQRKWICNGYIKRLVNEKYISLSLTFHFGHPITSPPQISLGSFQYYTHSFLFTTDVKSSLCKQLRVTEF